MTRRGGHTLIECIATFALIATTMTTVAVSLSGMHRACQRVRSETLSEMELQRFAVQFRADAHEALSATPGEEDKEDTAARTIRLMLNEEESIRYTLHTGYVQREQRRGGELLHRDTYRLPESYTPRWETNSDRSFPSVSLTLEPDPVDHMGPAGYQSVQVKAAVGLLKQPPAAIKS